jgi:hypothetical protein
MLLVAQVLLPRAFLALGARLEGALFFHSLLLGFQRALRLGARAELLHLFARLAQPALETRALLFDCLLALRLAETQLAVLLAHEVPQFSLSRLAAKYLPRRRVPLFIFPLVDFSLYPLTILERNL